MRVLFVQPSIPIYRLPLFIRLASEFGPKFLVIHSEGDMGCLTPSYQFSWSKCIGRSIKIGFGLLWQNNLIQHKIHKDDVIIIFGNPRYISTIIFILKAKLFGGKVLWWTHYRSSTSKIWRMNLRLSLMKFANGIIFYTQDEVEKYLSTIKKNIQLPIIGLNNGIDVNSIKVFRKKYNAKSRQFEILFLGRITQKSNFDTLVKALSHQNLNNITLNVIGNDYQDTLDDIQSTIINKVKINWYGKLINEKAISKVANKCRLFVYPGEVGLSLIHAMAYGLPCLVHKDRLKHMPEIAAFKEGITGLTFYPNDPENLAIKLSNMISNTVSLNEMSNNCLKIIQNEFNTTSMAKKFVKFIREFM